MTTNATFLLGFDIGGTFTDFVAVRAETGEVTAHKVLTTPSRPADAVVHGLRELLDRLGVDGERIDLAVHGTTLIANALIERKGANTGLLGTGGFRDILEIGREVRYDPYDLNFVRPEPLTPRARRLTVTERLDSAGAVVRPLDEAGVRAAAGRFRELGVEAIAVCFLHAFRNPAHENRARELLLAELPSARVSLSSEVSPQIREYQRASTTVANAYVQPLTEAYLHDLVTRLKALGYHRPLFLMLSSGGVTTVETASQFPIRLVESGPAAGTLAAAFYGQLADRPDLISFDMGGTTAKMGLIVGGQPSQTSDFEVARVQRFTAGSGLPIQAPVIELIEIGAGGGSLARVDELGLLKVGPQSAGADPGPACYGQGGAEPTVTDADLLLGYLSPDFFLGGRMRLDRAAAERAIGRLAEQLKVEPIKAAAGIFDVVTENMVAATRVHVAERGHDPRRYTLLAFGGAGPVHAYALARTLRLSEVIVPAGAGVASALGFLVAPKAFEHARSVGVTLGSGGERALDAIWAELEAEGRRRLEQAGLRPDEIAVARGADMRYAGQMHEIKVSIPPALDWGELRPRFEAAYRARYGTTNPEAEVELLTCRIVASGPPPKLTLPRWRADGGSLARAKKAERPVYFSERRAFVPTPVFDRYRLPADAVLAGPAIVEERESTTIVGPGATARLDAHGSLLMTLRPIATS